MTPKPRGKRKELITYTPVCEQHGKVIHFKRDSEGSWLHVLEVKKFINELKAQRKGRGK